VSDRERVAIIGGGPAGIMAAATLAPRVHVDLYEHQRTIGRKFLVAGDGGLNLTHAGGVHALEDLCTPRELWRPILASFGPDDLRAWFRTLGVETHVGSSGRVFPVKGMRPAEVLQCMRHHLRTLGVHIHTGHAFVGFDMQARPVIGSKEARVALNHDAVLFALGGASWPVTGSRGDWLDHFTGIGVRTVPFAPSNCGVEAPLPGTLLPHAGRPLKNVRVSAGGRSLRGEVMITARGLEGNAIYPLVPELREALRSEGLAELCIDLKPDLTHEAIREKLRSVQWSERAAALRLDRPSMAFFKAFTARQRFLDGNRWAEELKCVRVPVTALRPLGEAISTVGGIALEEVAPDLSLRRHGSLFVAGEMLDTDAPTGGYLLQGAFAMGRYAALSMLGHLRRIPDDRSAF
jgi:uncharacterized flavoprotein (TIGR03862 family)